MLWRRVTLKAAHCYCPTRTDQNVKKSNERHQQTCIFSIILLYRTGVFILASSLFISSHFVVISRIDQISVLINYNSISKCSSQFTLHCFLFCFLLQFLFSRTILQQCFIILNFKQKHLTPNFSKLK